jgi:membrane protein DedA with SNARE-associated domain
MPETFLLIGLAASTLLSEDAACIAAGVLIRQGAIGAGEGVAACAAGIYAGDALLWWAGRLLGRHSHIRAFRPTWCRAVETYGNAMTHHVDSAVALLASRFLPGTRLPMYLAAGAFGRRPRSFFLWTLVAVLLWTPLVVLGTASTLVGGTLAIIGVHLGKHVDWRRTWRSMSARIQRWQRWEFWPSAILYTPVALHILRLAWRHRGLGTLSAANPGIPEGGFVGESKFQILEQLPEEWTLGARLIDPAGVDARVERLRGAVDGDVLSFPLILKPDCGQRGVGVRLVRSLAEARQYFEREPAAVIAQRYHAGPFEAGIFYYRRPGEARGRIFSLTDKRFPVLVGDGRRTLEELIFSHPRFRLQAAVFLARHADERDRVPANGEAVHLGIAGNHVQGTMFLDGRSLVTPALERRIDEIAQRIRGFYIGRFDVRYADVERFRAGKDLAIVELNGVTSESTHIYDPSYSLLHAWRVLCDQWTLVFEIGAANRALGHEPTSGRRLLRLAMEHLRHEPALPIAS